MTAPQQLSTTAAWRRWKRMAANPNRLTVAHIGEDGVCDPDCTGCHYSGNGDCPDYSQGDADDLCPVCIVDPDVCAGCDHQRAFHYPKGGGPCLGHCDCGEFEEAVA